MRRSEVRGKCFSASWGSDLRRPLGSMEIWGCDTDGGGASKRSLIKKLIPLRYTWMVDVLILRTEWAYVMKLVKIMMSMEGNGRLCETDQIDGVSDGGALHGQV